jgi:hypothetical protein
MGRLWIGVRSLGCRSVDWPEESRINHSRVGTFLSSTAMERKSNDLFLENRSFILRGKITPVVPFTNCNLFELPVT